MKVTMADEVVRLRAVDRSEIRPAPLDAATGPAEMARSIDRAMQGVGRDMPADRP